MDQPPSDLEVDPFASGSGRDKEPAAIAVVAECSHFRITLHIRLPADDYSRTLPKGSLDLARHHFDGFDRLAEQHNLFVAGISQ